MARSMPNNLRKIRDNNPKLLKKMTTASSDEDTTIHSSDEESVDKVTPEDLDNDGN